MKGILSKKDKQKLLQMSELSLWLDTYDDIFSDFDPRPYSQRALSQDLLGELQRAIRGMVSGKIELKFLIPQSERSPHKEDMIKERLKGHFKKHFNLLKKEYKGVIRRGVFFALLGLTLMFISTAILYEYYEKNILASFLLVLFEPAGWFMFWEGLDLILHDSKEIKQKLEFYKKLAGCEITFIAY